MAFDPEKSAVYRVARQHTRAIRRLLSNHETRGAGDIISQLRRSTTSIPANLREGFGEWRPGKRAHYFMIAKASAGESGGHLDSLVDFGIVPEEATTEARDLQRQIIALLTTMVLNLPTE